MAVLLAVLLLPALGCSGELEARGIDEIDEQHCDQLQHYRGRTPDPEQRFHWYRARVGVGEPLPSSVTTRGDSATVTYVGREHTNDEIEEGFGMRSVFVGLQIVFAVVVFILLLMLPAIVTGVRSGDFEKKKLWRFVEATFVAIALVVATSYLGGSVIALDNASAEDVVVEINGTEYELPSDRHVSVRVSGFTFDVQAKSAGETIETLRLHPDAGTGDTLRRMLWGNGRFYYAVCGHNRIFLGDAEYGS